MPASNVRWPGTSPLTRLNPWYPGQFGVPGAWTDTGLREHPTGTTFYVDPNFPGASDQRDGTDPTSPLLTVATAITKCQPYRGDVIMVGASSAWYYGEGGSGLATAQYTTNIQEEVTVNVSGIRIVGVQPGGLGAMWEPVSNGGTCITVHAMDCIVEGFVFTEGATYTGADGIYIEWDGNTLFGENTVVRHCVFDDTVDTAIQLEYSWYCDIHDNYFWDCDLYGIYTDAGGSACSYATIHDNIFHDVGTSAIALLGGADNNHIFRNSIYNGNAEAGAAATNEGINLTGAGDNQVFANYFSCLLPVPANGDWDDLNTAAATDAWIGNYCLNGPNTTNPT